MGWRDRVKKVDAGSDWRSRAVKVDAASVDAPPGPAMEWDVPSAGQIAQYTETPEDKIANAGLAAGALGLVGGTAAIAGPIAAGAAARGAKGLFNKGVQKLATTGLETLDSVGTAVGGVTGAAAGGPVGGVTGALAGGRALRQLGKWAWGKNLRTQMATEASTGVSDISLEASIMRSRIANKANAVYTSSSDPKVSQQALIVSHLAKVNPRKAAILHKTYSDKNPAYRAAYTNSK